MTKKQKLPCDVRQEILWIVRGYDRRVKAYHEARRAVIDGSGCSFVDVGDQRMYMPRSGGVGRPIEDKAQQLDAIEQWPETRRMRAVEHAKLRIGLDIQNEEMRQRLTEGILLNCCNRNEYPFRFLNLPDISERDFYRRKDVFLIEVGECLGLFYKVGTAAPF